MHSHVVSAEHHNHQFMSQTDVTGKHKRCHSDNKQDKIEVYENEAQGEATLSVLQYKSL